MFKQLLRNAKQRLRLFLSECGRRARVLRDSLRRQPNRIDPSSRFVQGFRYGYWEREARGLELLKEWLSPEQFAQYDAKSHFEVTRRDEFLPVHDGCQAARIFPALRILESSARKHRPSFARLSESASLCRSIQMKSVPGVLLMCSE